MDDLTLLLDDLEEGKGPFLQTSLPGVFVDYPPKDLPILLALFVIRDQLIKEGLPVEEKQHRVVC